MSKKLTQRQLQRLIKEELENIKNEGILGNIGAAIAPSLPGGEAALNFMRSRTFDKIDKKLEELEARIAALETGSVV